MLLLAARSTRRAAPNRVLRIAWRLSKGYRLRPWTSPYLRWRLETYSGLHAEGITARDFFRFTWQRRWDLLHFLHWAAEMPPTPRAGELTDRV